MDSLFREHSKKIKIFCAIEHQLDPYEKNVSLSELNPLPIPAIVTDLSPTSATWKMPGINIEKSKEIIIEKKYKSLLEQSQKIEVDGIFYQGWRINGRLNYRTEGDYLRAYIYTEA